MRLFGQSQKVNSRNFRCAWFSEVRVPLATRQHPPRKTTMFAPKQAVCLLRRLRRQDPGCFVVLRSDFRKLAGALVAWGWTQTICCGSILRCSGALGAGACGGLNRTAEPTVADMLNRAASQYKGAKRGRYEGYRLS